MRLRCRGDGVYRLRYPVQRGVGPNGHVGANHVVVDRTGEPRDLEDGVAFGHFRPHLSAVHQLRQQFTPFQTQLAGTGERPVASYHDQPVDAGGHEVLHRGPASLAVPELEAARRPDDGAALVQDPGDVVPPHLFDVIATRDGSLPALLDGENLRARLDRSPHDRTHCGIHSLGVPTRGEHADSGPDGHFHAPSEVGVNVERFPWGEPPCEPASPATRSRNWSGTGPRWRFPRPGRSERRTRACRPSGSAAR